MTTTNCLLLSAAVVALIGCGSGGTDSSSTACTASTATATSSVQVVSMAFSPSCLKVAVGSEVAFTNDDAVAHTVTSDTGQVESFDSGTLNPGAVYRHVFSASGTIAFHCTFHSGMHATIIVE